MEATPIADSITEESSSTSGLSFAPEVPTISRVSRIAEIAASDLSPNMKLYHLAAAMRGSRAKEYSKRQFVIDAITRQCETRDMRMMIKAQGHPILLINGDPTIEYYLPAADQQYTIVCVRKYDGAGRSRLKEKRGLVLGDIVVMTKRSLILDKDAVLTCILPPRDGENARTRVNVTTDEDYDLDPVIDLIDERLLFGAFNMHPIGKKHDIITIMDQYWPVTPGIIVNRHQFVRISELRGNRGEIIRLTLSSPITDPVAERVTSIFEHGGIRKTPPAGMTHHDMFTYAEIMHKLRVGF